MKNRLIVDIYWCALSATWCCKTFTIIHAPNIVIQKIFVRAEEGMRPHPPEPPGSATAFDRRTDIILIAILGLHSMQRGKNDVVCPLSLQHRTFTVAAADNTDHNKSASTAQTSFQKTAISLM